MSNTENAYARLKTARMAAGFHTAIDFCQKFKIPVSTYNMHETGKRKIRPDIAEKYANHLGVSTAWLLTGMGEPYPNSTIVNDQSDLTEGEYLELLNYSGNKKLYSANTPELPGKVNVLLYTRIVAEMIEFLKSMSEPMDFQFVASHAVEIYRDIIQATDSSKDQITMIPLAMTIFKRQFQQVTPENNIRTSRK